jgi:hypothetical protein
MRKKTSRKTVKEQANKKKRIASPFSLLSLNMGKEEEEGQTDLYILVHAPLALTHPL